jgi:glycosyltransferase involved in cell wall biosynthesis
MGGIAGAPRPGPARPIRVLHVITRMIVGGAQETPMLSCALIDRVRFPSELLTGPETGSEGSLHEECRERGVTVHLEPSLVRAVRPHRDLVALWRLWRFFRRHRPDVVHTHSSKAGILGRLAARAAGVPHIVHTVHGWGFTPGQPPHVHGLYVALERLCARCCDTLVVVARVDREDGLRHRIGRPDQYRLVRSGIEVATYRDAPVTRAGVRARLGLPDQAFVVGCVGRLSPQKAPLDLLTAFARMARARPEAHLVLVGDGPLRAEVEAAIAREELAGRVHLLGLRREVPELLRAFDVFALASHWEGLPRVFPQAMAAGLPIVATRVDGAVDAIEEAVTGFLVEVGDTESMAERLVRLAADPAGARAMGAAGLARVEEFSAERMVRRLEDLYQALHEGRVPPGD